MFIHNKYLFLLVLCALLVGVGILVVQGQLGGGWASTSSLNQGVVGHWKLDQESAQSSTVTADSTGHANHGTISGNPTYTTDRMGTANAAMNFDGSGDFVQIPESSLWDFGTGDLAVSFWFNTSYGSREHALNIGTSSANISFDFNDGEYGTWVYWMSGGSPYVRTTTSYNDGNWHHLVFRRGSGTAELIIDGISKGTRADSTNIQLSGDLVIGAGSAVGWMPWNGKLDDIRVYNRSLSDAEIQKLYTHYKPQLQSPAQKGLVGHWPLTSESIATGGKAADTTPHANHGTISGVTVRNHGYKFPGNINAYINLDEHVSNIASLTEGTITAWIKTDSTPGVGRFLIMSASDKNDNSSDLCVNLYQGKLEYYVREEDETSDPIPAGDYSTATIDDGNWHHIAITQNSSGYKGYIDGQIDTGIGGSANAFFDNINTLNTWRIGNREDSVYGNEYGFKGNLADVRLYDRALDATEISNLYAGADIPSPVGYWPLKTSAGDISGNGNHGTPVNGVSLVGEAASFDGVDDKISAADSDLWAGPEISMTAWIKTGAQSQDIICQQRTFAPCLTMWQNDFLMFGNGSGCFRYNYGDYDDNEWHLAVGTINSAGVPCISIDGSTLSCDTNPADCTAIPNSTRNMNIGYESSGYGYFDGYIRDARVYNRLISQDEIDSLYNQKRSPALLKTGNLNKELIGHWDLKSKDSVTSDNLVSNSGVVDNADWVGTTGSTPPTGWQLYGGNGTPSLVTGNGFDGNAYRIDSTSVGSYVMTSDSPIQAGKTYYLRLKYRSNVNIEGGTGSYNYGTLLANTGDAKQYTSTFTASANHMLQFYVGNVTGRWLEVDEVVLKEINFTADSTPNARHGTLYGATVNDGYTSFDGTNDYIAVPVTTSDLGKDMGKVSVSAWIYADSVPSSGEGLASRSDLGYGLTYYTNGKVYAYIHGGGNSISASVTTGEWHHVVETFDGTTMNLYIDNVLAATKVSSYPSTAASSGTFKIGHFSGYFPGDITNVRIYDRALSPAEVQSLYDRGR